MFYYYGRFTLAGDPDTPSPEVGFTEKAVATQEVIVSGACVVNAADPSALDKSTYKMSPGVRKPTIWILTRSDTNQAVQPLKMARGWKFCI